MKTIKIFATFVFIFLNCFIVKGQKQAQPQKIKAQGDYINAASGAIFPENFFGLTRKGIYSFDKNNSNIGVVYNSGQNDQKTTITIYVYFAGEGIEGRLRNEYLKSLLSIANVTRMGLDVIQIPVKYIGEKYTCNGFKAILNSKSEDYNQLSLYECGTWFFKLRITTNCLDNIQILQLENIILKKIDPSKLTAQNPLNTKANILFSKTAFKDSVLLGAAMEAAVKKVEWAHDNVDENERASGFPDLYLNMHSEALNAFAKFEKEHSYYQNKETIRYLAELNAIIEAGFLAEFILDQYMSVMVIPEDKEVNIDGFYDWKKTHRLTIDLGQKFYTLSYNKN